MCFTMSGKAGGDFKPIESTVPPAGHYDECDILRLGQFLFYGIPLLYLFNRFKRKLGRHIVMFVLHSITSLITLAL